MLLPLIMALSTSSVPLFIGTYTSKEGSQGIYHATLDLATGAISDPTLAAVADSPSFLAVRKDRLYAVHESTGGDVSAYVINGIKLEKLNTQSFKGSNPCHLAIDAEGKFLLAAAYSGGSVGLFPIQPDSSLGAVASTFQNEGNGPNKGRQEGPHMHAVAFDGKGKAYACDLGTDEIVAFDVSKGELRRIGSGKAPAGGGPRHVELHPGGKFLFANNEMTNSVSAYSLDAQGLPNLVQTLSTLPEGEPTARKSTAELHIHPTGKWLYVSNRGHDSIAVYKILADGKLELAQIQKAEVQTPRGFDIDPTGKWLVAAGQSSNDLTTLSINPANGTLKPSGHRVKISQPVCIVFKP